MKTHVEKIRKKQDERIAEFLTYGIRVERGYCVLGRIQCTATEAEKLLRKLRKLRKKEARP